MKNDFSFLNEEEFQMILDGLDSLKSKNLAGDLMGIMIESMFDKKNLSPEAVEERKKKKALEQEKREIIAKQEKAKIDLVKSKLILYQSQRQLSE